MKENKPYEHNFFYSYHVNATRKPNIEKHLTVMVIWNMNELTKKKEILFEWREKDQADQ